MKCTICVLLFWLNVCVGSHAAEINVRYENKTYFLSAEFNVGPTIGDSTAYYSYALQGNVYYMWNVSKSIDLGVTTGVFVFLGEGQSVSGFGGVPDVFVPLAIAAKAHVLDSVFVGIDTGYNLSANNAFGGSNSVRGIDYGTYPQTRNIIFGINARF